VVQIVNPFIAFVLYFIRYNSRNEDFLPSTCQNIAKKIPKARNANELPVVQFMYMIEYSQYRNYIYERNVTNSQMFKHLKIEVEK